MIYTFCRALVMTHGALEIAGAITITTKVHYIITTAQRHAEVCIISHSTSKHRCVKNGS